MQKTSLSALLLIILLLFAGAKKPAPKREPATYFHETSICGGQGILAVSPANNGKYINVVAGTGHHHYAVVTGSDSAQIYFDQGLTFYYSYHFPEALASFKEATRFDGSCMMGYWGQALALGPYFNNSNYKMSNAVPAVLLSMQRLNTGGAKENDLANAMLQRYSADSTNADRDQLDLHYAVAMKLLTTKYPADNDIKVLYIDAVMLCHKWDFWNVNGSPKAWTPELVTLCEAVLKAEPQQPAALHYYIHLTEASRHPEVALPYADVLKDLLPGIAHMVHMSTHSYQRNGLFAKGVEVNEQANTIYSNMDAAAPYLHLSKNNPIHFFAVQSYCAMNAGMYLKGKPLYLRARERMTALKPFYSADPYAQYVYMLPEMACVRLGKWQEVLDAPSLNSHWKYAVILDDFAKGMASVRNNDLTAAGKYLSHLQTNLADSLLGIRRIPYNKPRQSCEVAAGILIGELLFAEGKTGDAIATLEKAVSAEDQLIYREPQEWLIPARQYLGSCLLKINRPVEAEKVYREDLMANPGNGWSLLGLYNSLRAQKKLMDAAKCKVLYEQAFEAGDIKPVDSVF